MKCMTHREFEERWEKARCAPQRLEIGTGKRPRINLSLNTVIENYLSRLERAVQAHDLDREDCEELRSRFEELRPLVRKVEQQASRFLTI